jgi:hypothetical protein
MPTLEAMIVIAAVVVCAGCGAPPPAASASAPALSVPSSSEAPPLFRFHVDFWANLNQVLLHEALLPRPRWEGPKSLKNRHVVEAGTLEPPEAALWRDALGYYDAHFTTNNLFDHVGPSETPPTTPDLDEEWRKRLLVAAPIYRTHFWPDHEQRDRAYVERMRPLVAAHGAWFAKRLAAVFGMPLPKDPIDVEVTPVVPPFGGFAQGEPPYTPPHAALITLSSEDPSYAGETGVEMLFHEVSHLIVGRVQEALEASAKRQGRKLDPRFWHDLIFYTAGHVAQERLGPAYVPFAERPSSQLFAAEDDPSLTILKRVWQPYLDGRVSIDAAVDAIAASFPPT